MKKDKEIWRPVVGYEELYKVSSHGRVKSLTRLRKFSSKLLEVKGKTLAERITPRGYKDLTLHKDYDGGKTWLVHRLVGISFHPNPDNKRCVNHIDMNPANNHADNLEWCTDAENLAHARINRVYNLHRGEDASWSKLKEKDVLWIRANYKKGDGPAFGEKYGVSQKSITAIVRRKSWKHI